MANPRVPSQVSGQVRIVSALGSGGAGRLTVAELQALAEACFVDRPRPPNWFTRKLVREAVDLERSLLALGPDATPIGYVLIGHEPDETVAHITGLGVLPSWRGLGLGAELMRGLLQPLRTEGFTALRALVEPPLRGFYERLGFFLKTLQSERHTLWAPGTGAADLDWSTHARMAWTLPGRTVAGWRPGTWARTPDQDTATLQLGADAWAHLSREGAAVLVHQLSVADDDDPSRWQTRIHAALAELRAAFHRDTAVLLYGCDAVSCITASLMRAQWRVAQTACEMQRDLGDAVDKHAPPAA